MKLNDYFGTPSGRRRERMSIELTQFALVDDGATDSTMAAYHPPTASNTTDR